MDERKRAENGTLVATFRADQESEVLRAGDQLVVFKREGRLEAHKVPEDIEPGRGYPAPVFAAALDRFIERHKQA